mmetsp:Transcript_4814/g.6101  ORF Transcript_4814/g.6101 Transcript_4814/m.6101 type:complete len:198 (+) Transcript_4814:161-754(+)
MEKEPPKIDLGSSPDITEGSELERFSKLVRISSSNSDGNVRTTESFISSSGILTSSRSNSLSLNVEVNPRKQQQQDSFFKQTFRPESQSKRFSDSNLNFNAFTPVRAVSRCSNSSASPDQFHSELAQIDQNRLNVKARMLEIKSKRKRVRSTNISAKLKRRVNLDDDDAPSHSRNRNEPDNEAIAWRRARYSHLFRV